MNDNFYKQHKESEEKHRLLITQMQRGFAIFEVIFDDAGKAVISGFIIQKT